MKIIFVCLGNICRSPMAEAMFRQMVAQEKLSDQIKIDSVATSNEEEGNSPHPWRTKNNASPSLRSQRPSLAPNYKS